MINLTAITNPPSGELDLRGRVSVVTGAARGLGRAIATALAEHASRVGLVDINPAHDTLSAIREVGGDAVTVVADVTDRAGVIKAVQRISGTWGRIDILVNNAGMSGRIGLDDVADEIFDRQIGVNLKAAIYWTQAVAPLMRELGGGKIINISSISARVGGIESMNPATGAGRSGPVYAAAKGGVISFTRWAARDLAPSRILVNAVCPGPMVTEANAGFTYDLHGAPIPHPGDPKDVAYAVLFLASQMSNHITGQTLNVDGGIRMD